jgi:hypothetical protein
MKLLRKKPHVFKIKNKEGQVVPFDLNSGQKEILDKIENDIETKGKTRLIVIKGRQLGISTLIETLLLSYALTVPAFTGYAMAHDATTANDLFDKIIKFEWQNMNEVIKSVYKTKRDNTRQLMFEDYMNSSSVTIGLSGRGSTIDFLHISEAGKMSENKQLWQEMITGTLLASEKAKGIVIESTANGGLGNFYEMVQDALQGKNGYDVIFIKWYDAKEYQETPPNDDWEEEYKILATRYNLYQDPINQFGINKNQLYWYYLQARTLKEEVKVEYPFTIDEAFVSKSRTKFDISTVREHMQKARDPLTINNDVKIYSEPVNANYVLTIDPASGLGEDYTGLKVRWNDGSRFREFASFKGKISEQEIAVIAVNLANYLNGYGKCLIMPETNIGSYLIDYIRRHYDDGLIYKRYYDDPTKQLEGRRPDYGWKTTGQNRDLMINKFAELFMEGRIEVNDLEELKEMEKFVWNDDKMRYEAQSPFHDDLLFADFINIQGFDYVNQYL